MDQKDNGNSTKIVGLDRLHSDGRATPIRQVEAYWSALRRGGDVPKRADVDPRGLENVLEYAFVLERIAPGFARFRVAGAHFTELAAMEVRGMPFSALFDVEGRSTISDALERVFTGPAVAELHLRSDAGIGRPELTGQMILLPLQSDLGDVSRILGACVTRGGVGRGPRKLQTEACTFRDLTGRATSSPEHSFDRQTEKTPAGFAEKQSSFEPGPVPYLRLVKTDT